MKIVRVVFEKGVELRFKETTWTISSAPCMTETTFKRLPDAIAAISPLRPILITESRSDCGDPTLLLRYNSKDYFDLCVSNLMNRKLTAETVFPALQVAYYLGAICYHCKKIAELYANIALQFSQNSKIPGFNEKGEAMYFGYQTDPYYEFDALVGAVRQSYDSLRYVLWQRFGQNGSTPRSLVKLLEMHSKIPERLHNRLTDSWQNFGVLITLYRDCIHHYVPLDCMASAFMQRNALHAWTTSIRIPDNPEVRSKKKFTFKLNRDALTYAWEVADEVLGAAMETVETTIPRQVDA